MKKGCSPPCGNGDTRLILNRELKPETRNPKLQPRNPKPETRYQKRLKMERLKQQEEEEGEFRKKMLEKFAEDQRIEQMNAQKRRMKVHPKPETLFLLSETKTRNLEPEYSIRVRVRGAGCREEEDASSG